MIDVQNIDVNNRKRCDILSRFSRYTRLVIGIAKNEAEYNVSHAKRKLIMGKRYFWNADFIHNLRRSCYGIFKDLIKIS